MASRWIDGRIVDSGASYLTARTPDFTEVVDDWVTRGLLRAWTCRFRVIEPDGSLGDSQPGPLRYAAPRGLRSLVADLASRGGVPVRQSTPIQMVTPGPKIDGERVDAVVLAMPDPQAASHLDPALAAERAAVQGREWSPVLALLAGWTHRTWMPMDGAFVHDNPVLDWIADDGRRRGDNAAVLVAHSTSQFAAHRLAEPQAATGPLLDALRALLGIPSDPDWTFVQRWTFARPEAHRRQLFYLGDGGVGLAGDGWGEPRVETAWRSGTALGKALAERLAG
jgi:predicted NAD/FAD-dependent oxidoreductase